MRSAAAVVVLVTVALALPASASFAAPGDLHLATGHVLLAPATAAGVKGNGDSYPAVLAAGGSTAAFRSGATNLAPADTDSASDVYAKELGDAPPSPTGDADLAIAQTDSPDPVLAGRGPRLTPRIPTLPTTATRSRRR